MRSSLLRSASATTQRKPLIHFLGKRPTLSSFSPLLTKSGARLFHGSNSSHTSLGKHKKPTPKHMGLDSIHDAQRCASLSPHLAGDDDPYDIDERPRKPKSRSWASSTDGVGQRRPHRRAYAYADAISPDLDAGLKTGGLESQPLMIRDDGDAISSLPSPLYALGRRDLESMQQTTNAPAADYVSKPPKPKMRSRVKWEPRPIPNDAPSTSLPHIPNPSSETPSWSPYAQFTPSSTSRTYRKYPPSTKTRAKWRRRRLLARANSKLRRARKRTPKIYRRVYGPWRDDFHIQRYMPKSIVLTPPHRQTSGTHSPGSSLNTKGVTPRSRLPNNDQVMEGVDLPRDKVLLAQLDRAEKERRERVEVLRVQAQRAVSRIVSFGKLLKGSGGAYHSKQKRWKGLW